MEKCAFYFKIAVEDRDRFELSIAIVTLLGKESKLTVSERSEFVYYCLSFLQKDRDVVLNWIELAKWRQYCYSMFEYKI